MLARLGSRHIYQLVASQSGTKAHSQHIACAPRAPTPVASRLAQTFLLKWSHGPMAASGVAVIARIRRRWRSA